MVLGHSSGKFIAIFASNFATFAACASTKYRLANGRRFFGNLRKFSRDHWQPFAIRPMTGFLAESRRYSPGNQSKAFSLSRTSQRCMILLRQVANKDASEAVKGNAFDVR
jgi:hypothetical protein